MLVIQEKSTDGHKRHCLTSFCVSHNSPRMCSFHFLSSRGVTERKAEIYSAVSSSFFFHVDLCLTVPSDFLCDFLSDLSSWKCFIDSDTITMEVILCGDEETSKNLHWTFDSHLPPLHNSRNWIKQFSILPPLRWGLEFASLPLHVGFVLDETESGSTLLGVSPVFPTTNVNPPFLHTHLIPFHPSLWWCVRRGRLASLLFIDLQ